MIFLLALELVDRVKIRDELEIARQLQHEILPREAPETPGYRFAHSYQTAQEIGGDYYDFLPTDDGRLVVISGDASGHGIAAGLLMVIASSTLRLAIDIDPEPSEGPLAAQSGSLLDWRLALLHDPLLWAIGPTKPVISTTFCAGHPFPLIRQPGGKIEELGNGSLPSRPSKRTLV